MYVRQTVVFLLCRSFCHLSIVCIYVLSYLSPDAPDIVVKTAHGHIADDRQLNDLIGVSPEAGFSGTRSTEVSLSPMPVMAFLRLLLAGPNHKEQLVLFACVARAICAASVKYLPYRYSVVFSKGALFPRLYENILPDVPLKEILFTNISQIFVRRSLLRKRKKHTGNINV